MRQLCNVAYVSQVSVMSSERELAAFERELPMIPNVSPGSYSQPVPASTGTLALLQLFGSRGPDGAVGRKRA
jgi:hypothetical protein